MRNLNSCLFIFCFLSLIFGISLFVSGHGSHDDHTHSFYEGTHVQELSQDNFHSAISSSPATMVEFYAPWCGHCKSLAPNYKAAADKLNEVGSSSKLAAVDCTVDKALCSEFGVKGFPTLKLFNGDVSKPVDYTGGRTTDDIFNFVNKANSPSYVALTTADEVESFLSGDEVEVLGLFSSLSSEEAKLFLDAANAMRNDYQFAVTTNPALFSTYSLSSPSVTIFKPNEDPVSFTDSITLSGITTFLQREAYPVVGDIGPENFQKYVDRGLPLVWVFYSLTDDSTTFLSELRSAASEFKGVLSVVKLDGVRWAEHAKHFGLSSALPGIVVEDRTGGSNFIFPSTKDVTSENLISFFQDFRDGKLSANVKSQDPPTDNNGPVRVVVGTTFKSEVIDNDKDVFVEFYAPWCGHCKNLAPKWEELGESFADNSNVVIAKVDATENDTPTKVQGFPTLILFPAGNKDKPINYEGDRTPIAMAQWLRSNGGTFANTAAAHEEL